MFRNLGPCIFGLNDMAVGVDDRVGIGARPSRCDWRSSLRAASTSTVTVTVAGAGTGTVTVTCTVKTLADARTTHATHG
jgi:hypothetical protein